jgi:hypothetical protein
MTTWPWVWWRQRGDRRRWLAARAADSDGKQLVAESELFLAKVHNQLT